MNTEFKEIFGGIKDPRVDQTKLNKLLDTIALKILGVMAGSRALRRVKTLETPVKNGLKTILD